MKKITKHPLYSTWKQMNDRCHKPSHCLFPKYGEQGIEVCDRWHIVKNKSITQFENFIQAMGPRPDGMRLTRKNISGNFEPANCYWGSRGHKPVTKYYDIEGTVKPVNAWAVEYGVDPKLIRSRLSKGWDILTALTTDIKVRKPGTN